MSETETAVPMDDKALFEGAISEPAAETPAVTEAETTEEQAKPEGDQPRDEHGRFAPKAEAKTDEQPEQPAAPKQEPAQADVIPPWRLREEAEARRQAESHAQQLESQLHQLSAKINELTQKPKEAPDLFVDPDGFIRNQVEPIQKQFGQELGQMREGFSRLIATEKYGDDVVKAAFDEMDRQMKTGAARYDYARIMQSPHPFGELVKWHKQQQARQTVGDDPSAWFEKELERRKSDPEFVKKHLAPGQPAQNGAAPLVRLPPSLNRQPGTAGNSNPGTLDDRSLYEFATR